MLLSLRPLTILRKEVSHVSKDVFLAGNRIRRISSSRSLISDAAKQTVQERATDGLENESCDASAHLVSEGHTRTNPKPLPASQVQISAQGVVDGGEGVVFLPPRPLQ